MNRLFFLFVIFHLDADHMVTHLIAMGVSIGLHVLFGSLALAGHVSDLEPIRVDAHCPVLLASILAHCRLHRVLRAGQSACIIIVLRVGLRSICLLYLLACRSLRSFLATEPGYCDLD